MVRFAVSGDKTSKPVPDWLVFDVELELLPDRECIVEARGEGDP